DHADPLYALLTEATASNAAEPQLAIALGRSSRRNRFQGGKLVLICGFQDASCMRRLRHGRAPTRPSTGQGDRPCPVSVDARNKSGHDERKDCEFSCTTLIRSEPRKRCTRPPRCPLLRVFRT